MYTKIAYDVEGSAAVITLDRPDDLNTIVTPEARAFIAKAAAERDGPFGDYSQGTSADKPDPRNVVYVGSLRSKAP